MVSFRKYLETRQDVASLREVLEILAAHLEISLTVNEVVYRLPQGTKRDTVHNRLLLGVKRGFIVQAEDHSYTKGRGRVPKRYQLAKSIWNEYQQAEKTPEKIERGHAEGIRLVPEDENYRKQLAASGKVKCPSCGSVILASELIRLPGSEMDICKTDYMKLALNALIRESIEGGLYRETVRQIPELTATGSTWDECRTNLFNAILEWIRNRQKEGLDLPPPG